MLRTIVRVDSKRRITLPSEWVKPGDFVEMTYIESEDVIVMRLVKPQVNLLKMLKKAQSICGDSKGSRKKAKTKK